jgi:lantibiotic modifying enzyme
LAALTGSDHFKAAALETIKYERSLFSPAASNWRDLRKRHSDDPTESDASSHSATAWCHGAPGIGMARLSTLAQIDDEETRAEIHIALEVTLKRGFGLNHSLCHGDLGDLDFLLQTHAALNDNALRAQIERLSSIILECIERHGPLCGVPLGVETPGLMTGLAGIGYGLLRVAEPSRIPSVLMLSPPL